MSDPLICQQLSYSIISEYIWWLVFKGNLELLKIAVERKELSQNTTLRHWLDDARFLKALWHTRLSNCHQPAQCGLAQGNVAMHSLQKQRQPQGIVYDRRSQLTCEFFCHFLFPSLYKAQSKHFSPLSPWMSGLWNKNCRGQLLKCLEYMSMLCCCT